MRDKHEKLVKSRIWEIDFARGIAIILMVLFHLVYDLKEFAGIPIDYQQWPWFAVGKSAAILFLFLAGISTCFSGNNLRHGAKVFLWGMVLTGVTFFADPQFYIRFGILHCLGMAMMIRYFLRSWPASALGILGLLVLGSGVFLLGQGTSIPWLFPVGLMAPGFASSDYYPILPWSGIFFLGAALGKMLYQEKRSIIPIGSALEKWMAPLSFLGRHSLLIYLTHQIALLGILYAVGMLKAGS